MTQMRFADGLRIFVGKGRMYSAAALAAAAGVPETTIRMAMRSDGQGAPPCLDKAPRLIAVLPPAFANHILEPTGKGGMREADPVALDGFHLQSSLAGRLAVLAGQLADGRHDHRERRRFKRGALSLIADLAAGMEAAL